MLRPGLAPKSSSLPCHGGAPPRHASSTHVSALLQQRTEEVGWAAQARVGRRVDPHHYGARALASADAGDAAAGARRPPLLLLASAARCSLLAPAVRVALLLAATPAVVVVVLLPRQRHLPLRLGQRVQSAGEVRIAVQPPRPAPLAVSTFGRGAAAAEQAAPNGATRSAALVRRCVVITLELRRGGVRACGARQLAVPARGPRRDGRGGRCCCVAAAAAHRLRWSGRESDAALPAATRRGPRRSQVWPRPKHDAASSRTWEGKTQSTTTRAWPGSAALGQPPPRDATDAAPRDAWREKLVKKSCGPPLRRPPAQHAHAATLLATRGCDRP